jgi:hypothetical protein
VAPPKLYFWVLLIHTWLFAAYLLPIMWGIWVYFYKNQKYQSTEFAWLIGTKKPYQFLKYQNIWLNAHIECVLQNHLYIHLKIHLPLSSLRTLANHDYYYRKILKKIKTDDSLFVFTEVLIPLQKMPSQARYLINILSKACISN